MTLIGMNPEELVGRKPAKRDGIDWQQYSNQNKKKKKEQPKKAKEAEPVVHKADMHTMFANLNALFKLQSPSYDDAENCFVPPGKGDILAELVLGRDSRHNWECLVKAMVKRLEEDTDLENIMSWIVNKAMDYIETTKGGKKFLIPKAAEFYRIFDPYFEHHDLHTDKELLMVSLALSFFLMYIFNTKTIFLDIVNSTDAKNLFNFVRHLFNRAIESSSEVLYRAVVFTLIWYQRYFHLYSSVGDHSIPLLPLHTKNIKKAQLIARKLCEKDGYPSIPSYSFDLEKDRKRKILACEIHVLANLTQMAQRKEEARELFTVPSSHQVACSLENWVFGTHLGWTLYQLPYKFKENCLYYFEVYILTGGSAKVGFLPHASNDFNGENPGELEGACLYDANEKSIWVHQREQHQVADRFSTQKGGAIVGCLLDTFSWRNKPCPETDPLRKRFYKVKFYLNGVPVEEVNPGVDSRQMAFFDRPFSLTVALAAYQQAFVMLRPEQWQFTPVSPMSLSYANLPTKDMQLKCLLRPRITAPNKCMFNDFDSDDEDFHECVQLSDSDLENDLACFHHWSMDDIVAQESLNGKAPPSNPTNQLDNSQETTQDLKLNVEFKKMPDQLWNVQKLIFIIKNEQDLADCFKSSAVTQIGKYLSTESRPGVHKGSTIFLNKSYQVNTKVVSYSHKKDSVHEIGPFYFRTVTDLAGKQKYEQEKAQGKEPKPLFTFCCCVAGSLEKMVRDARENEEINNELIANHQATQSQEVK